MQIFVFFVYNVIQDDFLIKKERKSHDCHKNTINNLYANQQSIFGCSFELFE